MPDEIIEWTGEGSDKEIDDILGYVLNDDEPYVNFKGRDTRKLGLIVEQMPDFHRPARRVAQYSIPGGSAPVIADEGGYDPYTTTLKLNANGRDLHDLYSWLRGEGWLISGEDPDYKCWASVYGQITDARFRTAEGVFDTLTVTLLVWPYWREVDEMGAVISGESATMQGKGHDKCLPMLTVYGDGPGTLTVNGIEVYFDDLTSPVILDCEAGAAYSMVNNQPVWKGHTVVMVEGWPELRPEGWNNLFQLAGGITSVIVQPQWRYL